MDSDPSLNLRKFWASLAVEMSAIDRDIADLWEKIRETKAKNEAVQRETIPLKMERDFKLRESKLLEAQNESLEKQAAMYANVVRPQLLDELKRGQEKVKSKEKKYKDIIEKYEKIWESYQTSYNKFPRVAERNEIVEKLRLERIKLENKKQECEESRVKAEQWREAENKRLEILKTQALQLHAEEQQARLRNQQLEQEVEEIKARIALQKVEKQKKQDEEKRDTIESESPSATTGPSAAIKVVKINIPVFKVPDYSQMALPPLAKERGGFSQVSAILRSPGSTLMPGLSFKSSSQPVKSSPLPCKSPSAKALVEKSASSPANVCAPQASQTTLSNAPKQGVPKSITESNTAGKQKTVDDLMEVNSILPSSPLSCGGSKRESILSTDNIAAKLKETIRPNLIVSEEVTITQIPMTKSSKDMETNAAVPNVEEDLFSQEHNISHQDTLQIMENDRSDKEINECNDYAEDFEILNELTENGDPPPTLTSNLPPESGPSFEDEFTPPDDDSFDLDKDGYDEYSSLQSPPPFQSVMSPAHAGFESSPSKGSDVAQGGTSEQPSTFSGFSFFSQPTTNIFGGQSSSDQSGNENKTSSKYSFLF